MDSTTILTKTAKGVREVSAKLTRLSRGFLNILKEVNGKASIDEIRLKLGYADVDSFLKDVEELVAAGYVREPEVAAKTPPAPPPPPRPQATAKPAGAADASDLDFTAFVPVEEDRSAETARRVEAARQKAIGEAREKSKRELEECIRKEAEMLARREAEKKAKREAEEKARKETEEKARREAEERARKEAEEQARREAEERARKEAEEQARREAEERARKEAEEQARREAEERARKEAEEQARREAEERARKEAEEQARREAEEQARKEAEEQARREAEEQARKEAEQKARLKAEEAARRESEKQAKREAKEEARRRKAEAKRAARAAAGPRASFPAVMLLKWALPVLALALALGVAAIHFVSFDGKVAEFEKAASEHFGQPVRIRAVHLALLPRAYWRLDGVSVGAEDQIKVQQARALAGIGAVLGGKPEFDAFELDAPLLSEEGLGWLLFGRAKAKRISFVRIEAQNVRLGSPHVDLPAFDVQAEIGTDGNWQRILLESQDKGLKFELAPKGGALQFDFNATNFAVPFGSALKFASLQAQGSAAASGIDVAKFSGNIHGGSVEGAARLKWSPIWSLEGEMQARQIDGSALAAELLKGERVDGRGSFAMNAAEASGLFPSARLQGRFALRSGALHGVDLVRLLQGESGAGSTQFSELAGSFVLQRGVTQLRDMQLNAGRMSAGGSADIDAAGKVDGRVAVALRIAAEQRRAEYAVSGTTDRLAWRRR